IDVDVSPLAIGHSLHLDELKLPEGIEKTSQLNSTLVTCVPPTKEEEAVASLAPTAEPEVITEKKPAEGEAAAGGEAKKEEKKK
ncbi:MAG: 50S ribosomal protein L25, partial [Deltaproteobacteria bacterium]